MSKRKQIVDYDDWLTTDPDAEEDACDDVDACTDDEPDDTPDLDPEYIGWL